MPRLFLALPIAEDVRTELARVSQDGPSGWHWVRQEAMHLTLAFLGEVEKERVSAAERALIAGARGIRALDLDAIGMGAFPDLVRAHVLWAGVNGDLEQLMALQERLARALRAEGFSLDDRPFRPHLTLARLRSPQPLPSSLDRTLHFGLWRAGEVHLYESRRGPGGVRYEVLATAGLDSDR